MPIILEGSISVKSALEGKCRKISKILIDNNKKDDRNIKYIINLAKESSIEVRFENRNTLDEISEGKKHGGILAEAGERTFSSLDSLLQVENPFIALLEGVEDPYNFGDAVRALYAAGATGLIVPKRNWLDTAGVVIKASAGATERIPTYSAENIAEAVKAAKDAGIRIYCAERRDAVPLYSADFKVPVLIAIGGEMRGLSRAVLDLADANIYIPYNSDFRNALSASSASAVCAFEAMRQRKNF